MSLSFVISCTYERPQIAKYARQSKTFNKSLKKMSLYRELTYNLWPHTFTHSVSFGFLYFVVLHLGQICQSSMMNEECYSIQHRQFEIYFRGRYHMLHMNSSAGSFKLY